MLEAIVVVVPVEETKFNDFPLKFKTLSLPKAKFRIIGQGRSSFHLSVLESVYIKTQNPVLCKQKDFIFSLGIFK